MQLVEKMVGNKLITKQVYSELSVDSMKDSVSKRKEDETKSISIKKTLFEHIFLFKYFKFIYCFKKKTNRKNTRKKAYCI